MEHKHSRGDRVRVEGTETIYEGRTGEVVMILTNGVYDHGVELEGVEGGLRWFTQGEIKPEPNGEGANGA